MAADSFDAQVRALFEDAKAKAANGLTLAEVGQIVQGLILLAVNSAFGMDETGEKKKAWVLAWLGTLFDTLLPSIPLPWWLAWIKLPMVSAWAKAAFLKWYSGSIETAVQWIKVTGKLPTYTSPAAIVRPADATTPS